MKDSRSRPPGGQLAVRVVLKDGQGQYNPIVAYIDTGAAASLISEEYLRKLDLNMDLVSSRPHLATIEGDSISTTGTVEVELYFGDSLSKHTLVVVDRVNASVPVLLGLDFLEKHEIAIQTVPSPDGLNIMEWKVTVGNVTLPGIKVGSTGVAFIPPPGTKEIGLEDIGKKKCQILEAVILPPSMSGYVSLVTSAPPMEAYFQPCPSIATARSLVAGIVRLISLPDSTLSVFTVPYINIEEESIEIEENLTVGFISEIARHDFISTEVMSTVAAVKDMQANDPDQEKLTRLYHIVDHKLSLANEESKVLKDLIRKFLDVFSTEEEPLTVTPYFLSTLQQKTPEVVYRHPYQVPICYHDRIAQQLKELAKQGVIRPSRSPYNAPLIPVPKKDGGLRLCLDFRALNKTLIDVRYPLPNISTILNQLGSSKLFTCLDLKQGYLQIPLAEDSRAMTAFTSPSGHWEFTSMPFGLKTAPACFQSIINSVLVGLIGTQAQVYLDDIIILGKTFSDHVWNLDKVLCRLREAHLKIKMEKCAFFKTEVPYLGHIISSEGMRPQPSKLEAIKSIPVPRTVYDMQSLLGLTNYYRKFVPGYSKLIAPLLALKGKSASLKKKDKSPIEWTPEADEAFKKLKAILINSVTLSFPDFTKEFVLTTDASSTCIGGVLQQRTDDGTLRPLTYFSRTLNPAERRYATIEREALGVVYGLQINRPLILGYKVEIQTDHRPLVWLLQVATPNGRIARWQTLLAEYDFDIKHIPGKTNVVADFLSRMADLRKSEVEFDLNGQINVVLSDLNGQHDAMMSDLNGQHDAMMNDLNGQINVVLSDLNGQHDAMMNDLNDPVQPSVRCGLIAYAGRPKAVPTFEWNVDELRELQDKQPGYREIKDMLIEGRTVSDIEGRLKYLRCRTRLPLHHLACTNGILYYDSKNAYGELQHAVVLPPAYIPRALTLSHYTATAGHGGVRVTLARLRKFAFWPGMAKDVENFVKGCQICTKFKKIGNSRPAPLRHFPDVSAPFERIHVDLVGPMGTSNNGFKYIMTIIDTLTKYLITVPLKSKEAREVAHALYENVICIHGVPKTMITDQGGEFVNSVLAEMCNTLGLLHSKITAFHPAANGQCERANYTIVNILRSLVEGNISIWDKMLSVATFAYNTAYHRVIKEAPFYLLFLRDPVMPYHMVEAPCKPWYNIDDYKSEMQTIARKVFERCQGYIEEGRIEMEKYYKPSSVKPLKEGDRVFLRFMPQRNVNRKLQPIYDGPYRILKQVSDVVVTLRNIRTGKVTTVHTDKVKPIHEDCMTPTRHPSVRRAFGFLPKENVIEHEELWTAMSPLASEESVLGNQPVDEQESRSPPGTGKLPRYNLRSKTSVADLPNVMSKPIEYKR